MKKLSFFKGTRNLTLSIFCLALSFSCQNTSHPEQEKADSAGIHDDLSDTATAKANTAATLDSSKTYVFLTFDDGPQPGTENVMQAIRETGVKATFFMVGIHATFSPLMKSYTDSIRNGFPVFLLANHSYTHAFNDRYLAFYHHPALAYQDFLKADSSLKIPHHIFRFPGNNAWVLSHTEIRGSQLVKPTLHIVDSLGGKVIGWDVEWHFKRNPQGHGSIPVQSATAMARTVVDAMEKKEAYRKNRIVLLAHDRMFHEPNYRDSLVRMINLVKEAHPEYVFETVEKLQ